MRFLEMDLKGAFLIDLEAIEDARGLFARTFCEDEFRAHGLSVRYPQCNTSFSRTAGTLRGMHFQADPHAEAKLIRCTAGCIYDVIVDLRPESPTFMRSAGAELTAESRRMVYVPEGFAHGFLTRCDCTEVFYMMSAPYAPQAARGVRWDDPQFHIAWPEAPAVISERDAGYPDFDPQAFIRKETVD